MLIETKYNVNDHVWVMHENAIKKGQVRFIKITVMIAKMDVYYHVYTNNIELHPYGYAEEQLYSSKEELLKTL